MLELNCTYEESKKILELGYDFGRNFGDIYKKRNCSHKYILVNCEKIKAQDLLSQLEEKYHDTYIERFTLERLSIDYEDSLYNNKHNEYFELGEILCDPNSERFVPIIPEAALEKCLPEFKTNKAWFSMALDEYEEERTFYWAFYTAVTIPSSNTKRPRLLMRYVKNQMLYENMHSVYFKSAFEAFLWLHENYPDELKAKFDEVMA
jgi:hypothetical protein